MNPVIEAKNIELIADGRSVPIIHKANLSILPGEFVVILGHNGSGKSSLVKILSGDIKPTSGEVLVKTTAVSSPALVRGSKRKLTRWIPRSSLALRRGMTEFEKAKEIITITQNPGDRLFLELTLKENIILWESRFAPSLRLSVDQIIGSSYKPERFRDLLDNPVSTLSGGEKQAFLLSLVLAHPPAILFLDEHTSALDPKASQEIMRLTADYIATYKVTTVMVTHHLEDALHYGNRIIIMNEGVISKDFSKPDNLSVAELKEMME